ncbi:MAG: hypothetical protein U0929_13805 [Planctomycetaceae bacterium]
MSPSKSIRTRTLFTAAAAMVLGLQVAPWPTAVMAQSVEPTELILQNEAQPIELVTRREQRRNRRPGPLNTPEKTDAAAQTPELMQKSTPAQQIPQQQQRQAAKPKSEVQLELEKLYRENGMEVPEMVDPRTSQPATTANGAGTNSNNGQAAQPDQGMQPPIMALGQPAQATSGQPQPAPAAPKKKSFFTKLFNKDQTPVQPPVETPYIPPTAPAVTAPAQAEVSAIPQAPGIVHFDDLSDTDAPTANAVAAPLQTADNSTGATPGASATPALSGAPAAQAIPQMDFNAPVEQPDPNQVTLGNAAPLTGAAESTPSSQPTATAEPADPFSDNALFPGSAPAPAKVAVNNEAKAPAELQVTPEVETPAKPAAPPETPKAEPEATENPYSGLTLDDNPFAKPAPRSTVSVEPRQIPLENVNTEVPKPQSSPPALMTPPTASSTTTADEEPPLVVEQKPARRPAPVGSRQTRAKQEIIAARKGMTGLKGFCPVVLRDDRNLVDAQNQYRAVYNSKTYYLSSNEAVAAFHADPSKYAPAARGSDVILLATSGEEVEGSLDHAVWYKGRLYMFSSAETMDTFVSAPSSHATLD